MLLRTRKLVLQHVGLEVSVALGVQALASSDSDGSDGPIAMSIVCHSLTEHEQAAALQIIRDRWPSAKILVFVDRDTDRKSLKFETMSPLEGPRALIQRTKQLMQ